MYNYFYKICFEDVIMNEVKKYLESLLDDFNSNLYDLNQQLDDININIEEDNRLVDLLKSEYDEHFAEFSPRKVDYKNEQKIKELEADISDKTKDKNSITEYIDQVQQKIDELEHIINKVDLYQDNSNTAAQDIKENINNVDTNILTNKINTIINYLPNDPIRAKIELSDIVKNLK